MSKPHLRNKKSQLQVKQRSGPGTRRVGDRSVDVSRFPASDPSVDLTGKEESKPGRPAVDAARSFALARAYGEASEVHRALP